MSEDKTEISEETIRELANAVQHIAEDSSAMRKVMKEIAALLAPYIERSGVQFGGDTWTIDQSRQYTYRIGVRKAYDEWEIGVEETEAVPEYWDGSNWAGCANPFSEGEYEIEGARIIPFGSVSRNILEETIQRLPCFLGEYVDELQRQKIRYADLRKKTERIIEVLSE